MDPIEFNTYSSQTLAAYDAYINFTFVDGDDSFKLIGAADFEPSGRLKDAVMDENVKKSK